MKIASVGVNPKSLPDKEWLIEKALKTPKYIDLPPKKALSLINEEIKKSGLYKPNSKGSKKPNKSNRKSS